MPTVSVVIPARNEQFLPQTIDDLCDKARGDIEIFAILEDYWPERQSDDPRVRYVHNGTPRGMRGAINQGAALAKGDYLMKCDGHCMFDKGFDVALAADCEADWVAVPRRYSLNPEEWRRRRKKYIDAIFLCYPDDPNDFGGPSLKGKLWRERNNDASRDAVLVDDLMSAQGSCWFMRRDYFHYLDLMDEESYGHFSNEFQEIGLKCWLSGGRVVRNKKTWYAHLHKGKKYGRGWPLGRSVLNQGAAFTNRWMDGRNWRKQDRDIRWLVHRFWPVPTWPEEAVRLVFHRRRGGSGEIRGRQMAAHFKARLNPEEDWHYPFDVHVWVKQEPRDLTLPGKHWLDVLDARERLSWLQQHPEVGVIACSASSERWLREKLGRDDVVRIPQHHCNYDRARRARDEIRVAGVVGGRGALQCDVDELERILAAHGIEFRWLRRYTNREVVDTFYRELDLQIVWRTGKRPWKNPLKVINAASYGIPTIAHPEPAYEEVEGYYWPIRDLAELPAILERLREGFDAQRLADKAEAYHIEQVAPLYGRLL